MRKFRGHNPQRTYSGDQKTNYKLYRSELRKDFQGRCGYTDCVDRWWGDGFHIDHFAPREPKLTDSSNLSKFIAREHDYTNLVYTCPQVNRAKGNDWPSEDPDVSILGNKGYLDPCCVDYNEYFERTNAGGIVPKDHPIAKYMWSKLRLYLKRYEIYWRIEQLENNLRKLSSLQTKLKLPKRMENEVKNGISDLVAEYIKYLDYLQVNYEDVIR